MRSCAPVHAQLERDGAIHSEFEAHYDLLPDALLVHAGGRWFYANPAALALLGATCREEIVGREIREFIPADLREAVAERIATVTAGTRTDLREQRLLRLDGREVHVEVSGVPSVTPDGRPAVLITARDVGARRATEQRFRATFEQSAVGMAHVAVDGRWLRVNDRLCALLGYSRAELEQQNVIDREFPPDRQSFQARVGTLVAGDAPGYATERRYMRKDGALIWVTKTVSLVRTAEGRPDYLIVVVEDISKRKHAEAAVAENEERFRHLVEHGTDLILVVDRDARVTFASRNTANVVGHVPAEIVGRSVADFDEPGDAETPSRLFAEIVDRPGERRLATLRIRHKSGGWRVLDVSAVNLFDDPSVAGIVINAHDVTERNRLATEVAQLKRVESLGRVAASVAHELNNVLMSFQAVAMRAARAGVDPELQVTLKRALLRGKSVTADILRYARPALVSTERVSFADWLVETAHDLAPLLGTTHRLTLSLDENLGWVRMDRQQMAQVLTNLVTNARDAMRGGGTIAIAGRHSDEREAEVCFTVTDRGCGIGEEVREQIFDPLFTTKSSGTGLGLAIVQQIVLRHGGRIEVVSEEGEGATFAVALRRD